MRHYSWTPVKKKKKKGLHISYDLVVFLFGYFTVYFTRKKNNRIKGLYIYYIKKMSLNVPVLVSGHYVCDIQLVSRVKVQLIIIIFIPYSSLFSPLSLYFFVSTLSQSFFQAISSVRGPTYSSASRSSPWKRSWRWRSPAARGRAPQTGDIHCPWKCQFSSPQSRRSCTSRYNA